MGENCVFHDEIVKRLTENEDAVSDLKLKTALDTQKTDMLFENTMKAISELSGAIKSLKDTNKDIQETLIGMQNEIKDSNRKADDVKEQLEKLDAKVCQIDENDTFSVLEFIKKNLVAIIIFSSGIGFWLKTLM